MNSNPCTNAIPVATMSDKFDTRDIGQDSFLVTGGAGFIGSHITAYLLPAWREKSKGA
jgi:hypothetical protein